MFVSSFWVTLDFSLLPWRSFHVLFQQVIFGLVAKSSEMCWVKRFPVVFWCVHRIFLIRQNPIRSLDKKLQWTAPPIPYNVGGEQAVGAFWGLEGEKKPLMSLGLGTAGQWQVLVWLHHEVPVPSSGSSLGGGRAWEQDRLVVVHLVNICHVQQFWLWEFLHQVFQLFAALSSWPVVSIDVCLL